MPRQDQSLPFSRVWAGKVPRRRNALVKLVQEIGLGDWFRYFTAVAEITASLLALIPRFLLALEMIRFGRHQELDLSDDLGLKRTFSCLRASLHVPVWQPCDRVR